MITWFVFNEQINHLLKMTPKGFYLLTLGISEVILDLMIYTETLKQ